MIRLLFVLRVCMCLTILSSCMSYHLPSPLFPYPLSSLSSPLLRFYNSFLSPSHCLKIPAPPSLSILPNTQHSSLLPFLPTTNPFHPQQSTDVSTGGNKEGQSDISRPPSDGTQPTESSDQDPSLSPSRLYGRALQTPCRDLPGQEEGEGEGRVGEGIMRDVERDVQTSHGKPG